MTTREKVTRVIKDVAYWLTLVGPLFRIGVGAYRGVKQGLEDARRHPQDGQSLEDLETPASSAGSCRSPLH